MQRYTHIDTHTHTVCSACCLVVLCFVEDQRKRKLRPWGYILNRCEHTLCVNIPTNQWALNLHYQQGPQTSIHVYLFTFLRIRAKLWATKLYINLRKMKNMMMFTLCIFNQSAKGNKSLLCIEFQMGIIYIQSSSVGLVNMNKSMKAAFLLCQLHNEATLPLSFQTALSNVSQI